MRYRVIPGLDREVSVLSLGGWLTFGEGVDDEVALATLHAAYEGGVNMIDLADIYAAGAAEELVGRFVRQVDRDRLVLTSKVFWPTSDDPADRGLSRRHIHAAIDKALDRLGVERLDLYYCHREDPGVPLAETVEAMGDLVRAGKIAAWGTSCWRPRTLREAHRLARSLGCAAPVVEQSPYNLLQRWIEQTLLPCCQELGMAVTVFSPLAQGVLTGKYLDGVPSGSRADGGRLRGMLHGGPERHLREFVALCDRSGLRPAVAALAWALRSPGVASAIMGASSPRQLRENLAAAELELPLALAAEMERVFPVERQSLVRRLVRKLMRGR